MYSLCPVFSTYLHAGKKRQFVALYIRSTVSGLGGMARNGARETVTRCRELFVG